MTPRSYLIVTNYTSPRDAVISLARRLLSEGDQVSVLAPWNPNLSWLDVHFYDNIADISGVEDMVVIAMSPDVVAPLRAVLGSKIKKLLGPEGLAAQVSQSLSLSLSFFSQAGARVVPYKLVPYGETIPDHAKLVSDRIGGAISSGFKPGDQPPFAVVALENIPEKIMSVCVFVSNRHLLPFALQYSDVRGLLARGGPNTREGVMILPVWSKQLARVAESVRMGCVACGYSGPVFLDLCEVDGKLCIMDVHYQYPPGFMTAFMGLLSQSAGQFFYSWVKGKFFVPNIPLVPSVALMVHGTDQVNSCEDISAPAGDSHWSDSYHVWVGDRQKTYLPDQVWDKFPEAGVKLDGFSGLPSTLEMLKSHGFEVGLKPDEANSEPQQEKVEEALSCS